MQFSIKEKCPVCVYGGTIETCGWSKITLDEKKKPVHSNIRAYWIEFLIIVIVLDKYHYCYYANI